MENIPVEKRKQTPVAYRLLTDKEEKAIARFKERETDSDPIFCAESKGSNGESMLSLALDQTLIRDDAINLIRSRLMEATGSKNPAVAIQLFLSIGKAISSTMTLGGELAQSFDIFAKAMQALAPQDEYEGQLVSQLVVLHEQAMEWLGKAKRSERVNFANVYLNGASKLLSRHHETMEALLKYRRRGEQRVHVEHVHVHQGAQAVIGNVTTGGGVKQKNEEGPHAKV